MNKFIKSCFVVAACAVHGFVFSQSTSFEFGSPVLNLVDRLELKSGNLRNDIFTDISPLDRSTVHSFILNSLQNNLKLTRSDKYWLNYYYAENLPWSADSAVDTPKRTVFKYFYTSKANLYQVHTTDFDLVLNPVINFLGGYEANGSGNIFRNTRGAEIRGQIDHRLGFYSVIMENQARFPAYIDTFIRTTRALPGEGYWKPFKKNAYDFFDAKGYITFSATKHINLQFGNSQNFIGNGYRSLLLSDFAKDYLSLKVRTKIWRFQYENIFAQFTHYVYNNIKPYPRKYGAFHYLSFDAAKFLNVGLFEGVMFFDSKKEGRGFELSYLNPVIFYRSAEQQLGSSDNSVVGANLDILPVKNLRLYGQLLFDEFKIHELMSGNGWWGNKYGFQAGFKYIDIAGIPNLDFQGEFNLIRPYTYSEDSIQKSYTQFSQSLAHPLGANLKELIAILSINPYGPFLIKARYFFIQQGKDTSGSNWGSDPLKSYVLVEKTNPYGNRTLQGVNTLINYWEVTASLMIKHNLFIDGDFFYRTERSKVVSNSTMYFGLGLRLNFFGERPVF